MACDFGERMERGKVLAQRARNRGQHTGKAAKGWNAARPVETRDSLSWHAYRALIVSGWQSDAAESLAIYTAAVFPERAYVPELDGPDCPTIETVIAARLERERESLLATF